MPLPTPEKNEEQDKFISRCMGNPTMNKDFKENAQRAAVCYSQYKKRKKNSKASVEWNDDVVFLVD